jgi:TPR repeat protein
LLALAPAVLPGSTMAMRPTATLVSFLVLAIASAVALATTLPLPTGPLWQEAAKPARLTAAEIRQLQAKAEAGDATAQSALGKVYQDGNGVAQNDATALTWFRKAADQGDPAAENNLGVMYRMGAGVPRDKDEAVHWYLKSAKQGNGKAMFNLGAAYYNGDGVDIDDVASFAWFLLAQEAGDPAADEAARRAISEKEAELSAACVKIGQMYETGNELPNNPVEALKWYRKAADAGDMETSLKVAKLLLAPGRGPTQEDYAEARKRCEDAAQRNPSGAYCMALIYRRGIGVAKDPVESTKWLSRAAESGFARAVLELGEAYWKGEGVKPDPVVAYSWVWLAYNSKVPGAEQDEQQLSKELSAKQVEQAKQKAVDWSKRHRPVGLVYRQPDSSPPAK